MSKNLLAVFRQKEEDIMRQAELAAQETNDYIAVKNYVTRRIAGIKLTQTQQRRLEIYQFAYNQLVSGKYTESEVVSLVKVEYKQETAGAMQLIKDARELFNTALSINKIFEIKVQLELNRIEMQKASKKGDLKAWAMLDSNRQKWLAMLPEAEEENHADFEGHTIIPQFNPELLGVDPIPQKELDRLLKDIEKQFGGEVGATRYEDADFIEIRGKNGE